MANDSITCYICYEQNTLENPYAVEPCQCKGSIAIHLSCLQEQIAQSRICCICKTRYKVHYLPNKNGLEQITHRTIEGYQIDYTVNEAGEKHGMFSIRHSNGQLLLRCVFVNGIRDGPVVEYYLTGQIKCIGTYKDDQLNGEYSEWFEDGWIREESNYEKGAKHGICTIWKRNGFHRETQVMYYQRGRIVDTDVVSINEIES